MKMPTLTVMESEPVRLFDFDIHEDLAFLGRTQVQVRYPLDNDFQDEAIQAVMAGLGYYDWASGAGSMRDLDFVANDAALFDDPENKEFWASLQTVLAHIVPGTTLEAYIAPPDDDVTAQ